MYNGIGLQTARGTGTNGYVQSNLSHLLLSRRRIEYNAEDDIKRAEEAINRRPNEDLLDHQRKRQVEMKCAEFEMLMENKGFEQADIDKKVSDYRRLLLSQLESGELNVDDEISVKDSHARQRMAAQKRDQWKEALGIKKDFVPGSSMQNMNKDDPLAPEDEKVLAEKKKAEEEAARLKQLVKLARKEQKKKEKERKKKKKEKKRKQLAKKRKRAASTSSSSSSSSDSDSDSDSSSSSSDSDSTDSSDSDREERKRRKAKNRKLIKQNKQKDVKPEGDSDGEERRGDMRRRDDRGRKEEDERRIRSGRRDDSRDRMDHSGPSNRDDRRDERKKGGADREIKEEPVSGSDDDRRKKDSSNRSPSPYIDSDLDEDTRRKMKHSMVSVVKKN